MNPLHKTHSQPVSYWEKSPLLLCWVFNRKEASTTTKKNREKKARLCVELEISFIQPQKWKRIPLYSSMGEEVKRKYLSFFFTFPIMLFIQSGNSGDERKIEWLEIFEHLFFSSFTISKPIYILFSSFTLMLIILLNTFLIFFSLYLMCVGHKTC